MKNLGEGAVQNAGGQAMGWLLGAMGVTSAEEQNQKIMIQQLKAINSELRTMEATLEGMEHELTVIDADLKQLDCDLLTADAKEAQGLIDQYLDMYKSFIAMGSGSTGYPANVPPMECTSEDNSPGSCVHAWASAVLASDGILQALTTLNEQLGSDGGNTVEGILGTCLKTIPSPVVTGGLGETQYYEKVHQLVNYYYYYQTTGLLLAVEAFHFFAWEHAGRPGAGSRQNPISDLNICQNPVNRAVELSCSSAVEWTNTIYSNVVSQFTYVGVPFSDNDVAANYADNGIVYLFPKSLENFTAAAGDTSCPFPLDSGSPCGTGTDPSKFGEVSYAGYSDWIPAGADQLGNLMKLKPNNIYNWDYMRLYGGFYNTYDKLIMTTDTAPLDFGPYFKGSMHCFLDTSLNNGLVCDKAGALSVLTQNARTCDLFGAFGPDPIRGTVLSTGTNLPSDRDGFYDAQSYYEKDSCYLPKWSKAPQWWVTTGSSAPQQYYWPVKYASSADCTRGRVRLNPAGVPTRCGDDLDAALEELVPKPPTNKQLGLSSSTNRRRLRGGSNE